MAGGHRLLRAAPMLVAVAVLVLGGVAARVVPGPVVVEDWTGHVVGSHGVPAGWQGQSWGGPRFDLTVTDTGGRRALRLRSDRDRSTISKALDRRVDLRETPILQWTWKVVSLPPGGDARRWETTDQAAQVYVVWRRFPDLLRSRVLGYAWDTTVPAGATIPSQKTRTVTYVIVRSGASELGRWLTERRDVREDYRRIFGEEPEAPTAITLSIDSNDTASSAESFIAEIAFHPR